MRFHARVAKGLFQLQYTHSFVFVFAERSGIDPPVTLLLYSQTVCGKKLFRTITKWRQSARHISLNSLLARFMLGPRQQQLGLERIFVGRLFLLSVDSLENNLITLNPSLVPSEESFKCL